MTLNNKTLSWRSLALDALAPIKHIYIDSWKVEPSLDAVKRPGTKATNASVLQ